MNYLELEQRNYIIDEPHAETINEAFETAAKELLQPFPSTPLLDFPLLTKITGGFRPREFTIFCGATGTGKTTTMANWSKSLLTQKVPHFVASVETGHTDFIKRVISAIVGEDWNTGDAVPIQKLQRMMSNHGYLFAHEGILNLSLYDNRFSVETLMSDIAWMVKHKGIKIAIIDNLNFFLEVKRSADQLVEMDRVVHELIIFCKRIDVHVIMIMHPKKNESGRVETEFDVKGSSTAVQEAHNIFLFNRAGNDLVEAKLCEATDRELKIAKMRRKGRVVGRRLILKSVDGVQYVEGDVV